jgi:DNA ligase-1
MPVSFKSLSKLLEKVEATKKRLEIIDQTANFLKTLSPEEIEPATNMIVGRAFPKYSQKTLDVSWSTLTRIFERISAFDWDLFRQAMVSTGDIGSATKKPSSSKLKLSCGKEPCDRRALEHWKDLQGLN